jgi:hypothetical protein
LRSGVLARPGANAHQDAAERRRGKVDVELRGHAVERLGEDALEAHTQLGVEALARHEDQAAHEARIGILAHEQAQALALAELQDRHGIAVEIIGADLQELVARIGLEDRGERLAAVAGGQEPGARDHLGDLAPHERHLRRVLGVRGVRIEAKEARLAAHLALRVEMLDPDIVELARSVHRRARIRLGEHQELLHAGALARLGRQRREARRQRLAGALAQDAAAGAGHDAQHILAAGGGDLVVAAAEEGEMVVEQPGEERASLFELGGRQPAARRLEAADHLLQARAHRLPVLDRGAHVGEHFGDPRLELRELRGVALAVDLDVHEGLEPPLRRVGGLVERHQFAALVAHDTQHRVNHEVQREALPVHFHRHRIDEERHIVVHDLDHRVRALPAVLLARRVVGAHFRLARGKPAREVEVRRRRPLEVDA